MTEHEVLERLDAVQAAMADARAELNIAVLSTLAVERDELKASLAELRAPTRADVEAELSALRVRLAAFDPQSGLLAAMTDGGPGGRHDFSADNVMTAISAAEQERDDAGITWINQRIAYLEEQLRALP